MSFTYGIFFVYVSRLIFFFNKKKNAMQTIKRR